MSLSLVRAYERNLYGFKNAQAVGYYQKRKQIAQARAAGGFERPPLFPRWCCNDEVPPGEFREGTIFFPTREKQAEFLEFSARLDHLSFLFSSRSSRLQRPDSDPTDRPR